MVVATGWVSGVHKSMDSHVEQGYRRGAFARWLSGTVVLGVPLAQHVVLGHSDSMLVSLREDMVRQRMSRSQ